jgi:DNA-binding MarR family transcriptional regulator/GNAT superfamily N-acetyltransferase
VATSTSRPVEAIRSFNRFWTRAIGVLDEALLQTPYSLTEARVIFELAQEPSGVELAALRRRLALDAGYLSRITQRFASDGLVTTSTAPTDARRRLVRLTEQGHAVLATLDRRASAAVEALLQDVRDTDQHRLVEALETIRSIFSNRTPPMSVVIRGLEPGDLGWVVARHGALYAEEFGWDQTFEALVARIVADYVDTLDSARERAWIAEVDGEPAGCVFCVRKDSATAQLRILLVEPALRGFGIGTRLVDECIGFARRVGYRQLTLWTNDVLVSARRIYEAAGFTLVDQQPHHSFGQELVGQHWTLDLTTLDDRFSPNRHTDRDAVG